MTSPLDALNALVDDLEDEGHSLAGRARDVASSIRDEYEHLDGKTELETLAERLADALVPELRKRVRADVTRQVAAEMRKGISNVQIHHGPGAGRAF